MPYAQVIRSLLDKEEVGAAQRVLRLALREGGGNRGHLAAFAKVLARPRITPRVGLRDPDRSAEFHALGHVPRELQGKWVAIVGAVVVAEGATLRDLLTKLKDMHLDRAPLVHHID